MLLGIATVIVGTVANAVQAILSKVRPKLDPNPKYSLNLTLFLTLTLTREQPNLNPQRHAMHRPNPDHNPQRHAKLRLQMSHGAAQPEADTNPSYVLL